MAIDIGIVCSVMKYFESLMGTFTTYVKGVTIRDKKQNILNICSVASSAIKNLCPNHIQPIIGVRALT